MADESGGYEARYQKVMVTLTARYTEQDARDMVIVAQMFRMLGIEPDTLKLLDEVCKEYRARCRLIPDTLGAVLQCVIEGEHIALCVPDPDIPF